MNKIFLTLALLVLFPVISSAQQRNAFVDPATGVLKAVGYVEKNSPGEIKIPVTSDFTLKPGEWKWDGKSWVAVPPTEDPASVDLQDLVFSIDDAVRSPLVTAEIKDVLLKRKKFLANK
jgi:hypothetical protein